MIPAIILDVALNSLPDCNEWACIFGEVFGAFGLGGNEVILGLFALLVVAFFAWMGNFPKTATFFIGLLALGGLALSDIGKSTGSPFRIIYVFAFGIIIILFYFLVAKIWKANQS